MVTGASRGFRVLAASGRCESGLLAYLGLHLEGMCNRHQGEHFGRKDSPNIKPQTAKKGFPYPPGRGRVPHGGGGAAGRLPYIGSM